MNTTIVKAFEADGTQKRMALGQIPIFVVMYINTASGQNPNKYVWSQHMEDYGTATYGILTTGSTGVKTVVTTAATGITTMDETLHGLLIPAPDGSGDQFRIPEIFSTSQDYTSTYTQSQTSETVTWAARTASVAGGIIWPTTRNGYVYELTTATGTGTSEPTWGTIVGGTTTDGGSNVWTCREEKVATRGNKGIIIGATTQTDGHLNIVIATLGETSPYLGDSANYANIDPL